MRILTLFCLFLLASLFGRAQVVTIDQVFDSTAVSGCDTVGGDVGLSVYGNAANIPSGDTIDIYVDHDDGNGSSYEGYALVTQWQSFDFYFQHSYSSSGTKNVEIIAEGPSGSSDTAYQSVFVSDSCTTIQGNVFVDQNGDCMHNSGESLLQYKQVKVEHNGALVGYAFTDASGTYQVDVPASMSPYEVTLLDTLSYSTSCPSSATQMVNNPPNYNVDYALECSSTPDFSINHGHVWGSGLRTGFESTYHFGLDGPLHCLDSLTCVKMVLDPLLTPLQPTNQYITPPYDAVNGDTVIWNMDTNDLSDFNLAHLPVDVSPNAVVGDTICVDLILCASNDADPSNNSMEICAEVVNSWDPNNKKVIPRGEGADNHIDADQRMTYTVNFQNTGTAPAIDIEIVDTLDPNVLRPSTFRVMSSSHEIDQVEVSDNNVVSFQFNNIMLPDSGASQPDSKGFVKFSIDQQPGLSDGTVIENNAAIYFDQNPAVITNEAMNTIGEPTSIEEHDGESRLSAYPNPASDRLHIRSSESMNGSVVLRDITGKLALDRDLNGTSTTLELGDLPSGVYILSVQRDDGKAAVRKKVMIE